MPPENNKLKIGIDPVFTGSKADEQSKPTGVYDILSNQKYEPSGQIETMNSDAVIQKPGNERKSIVRTYKDDIASAIQANHLSSINIAIAENERMHSKFGGEEKDESPTEKIAGAYSRSRILTLIGIIIVVVTLIGVGVTYYISRQNSAEVVTTEIPAALITTEYKDELSINSVVKDRFVNALASKINDIQIPVNNIYNVFIATGTSSAKRLVNPAEFVSLANLRMPDLMVRSLSPDYMVGMFSFGQDLPFIIFKTTSYENTYAGLIDWEKYLEKDFTTLFRLEVGEGTSTIEKALTPSVAHKFEDGVIINKDVRLLRNAENKIVFLYAILDKNTIVITVNDTAFKEIVSRLNKEKSLKR